MSELTWIKGLFKRYGKLTTFIARTELQYSPELLKVETDSAPQEYEAWAAITNVNTEQRKRYMLADKNLLNKSISNLYVQSEKIPAINDLVIIDGVEWIVYEVINIYKADDTIQASKLRIIK